MEFEDVFADVLSTEEPTTEEPAQDAQTEPAANEAAEQEGTGEPQEVQTEDQNAQFAAARRRAEAEFQRRMELEQQKHTRELDELVQKAYGDQVNPYTGQPIRTKADFDAYEAQFQQDRMQQAGVTPEMIQQEVMRNPLVQQLIQSNQQMQMQQGKAQFEAGLAEIAKLDPSIQSFDDLMKSPVFTEFDRLYRASGDMVSAFKAANYDAMAQNRFDAGAQAQRNSAAGKQHLAPINGGAGESLTVPGDVLDVYKSMFPEMTEAQILEEEVRAFHDPTR